MALHPLHEKEQIRAIEIELATARDYIQDDLRNYISRIIEPYDKVGLDDSIFEFAELVGYRINNNRLDIAEDLDVKSRYGLTTDDVARTSVGRAFRGHHNEDFKPEYQFEGLFSEEMNDMIEKIRDVKSGQEGGRISRDLGLGYHGRTAEERAEHGRKGYANGLANLTSEELSEHARKSGRISRDLGVGIHAQTLEEKAELGRKGGLIGGRKVADMINPETGVGYLVEARRKSIEARGAFSWRDNLEYVLEIGELKYEKGLTWKETTTVMNEKYDKDWATATVRMAYQSNKDLLPDEEE